VGRIAALLALATLVGVYYGTVKDLPGAGLWWEVAWLAFVVIPAVCGLVLLVLPLARLPVAILASIAAGFLGLALLFGFTGLDELANFAKLGTMAFFAWTFLWFFEELSWVVLVACVVPWVDAYSVWRGPTKTIVNHHASVFSVFSFAFPLPNGTEHFWGLPTFHYEQATHLGLPDLLFFSLFLAAAQRFGLRVYWTWLALSLSFGATMALAIWQNLSGLPALPLLAVGFLVPNADLLWRRLRSSRVRNSAKVAVD
jgi:hypothetical protein